MIRYIKACHWYGLFFCMLTICWACSGDKEMMEEPPCTVSYREDVADLLDVACTKAGCHNSGSAQK